MKHCLILDIGKTNVKLHVLDASRHSVFSESRANTVLQDGLYPHADIDGIWQWMMGVCKRIATQFTIGAISITTHGATAALVNTNNVNNDAGLVLPVLDYEYQGLESLDNEYNRIRPAFTETYSPNLPGGLNLGRQLYWLEHSFPEAFKQTTDILMYPQYWAWRLTGICSNEVTSLGCHTDLWAPESNAYSSLVNECAWAQYMPQIVPAWQDLGYLRSEVCEQGGLPADCKVYAGLHDSNASYLRYRLFQQKQAFTVISTGTWTILMAAGTDLKNLRAQSDMLANVNAMGESVACARFMGGREFEAICEQLGGAFGDPVESAVLQKLIDKNCMALPDFSDGSGPFGGRTPAFIGDITAQQGTEIATLYCALMIDYQLDALGAQNDVYIEGAFLQNPLLCSIVAQLRRGQKVWLSGDATGTVQGCAYLTDWDNKPTDIKLKPAIPTQLNNLQSYKDLWLTKISETSA